MSKLYMNPAWLEQLLNWEKYSTEEKQTMMFNSYFSGSCNITIRQLFYQKPLSTWHSDTDWVLSIRFIDHLMKRIIEYHDHVLFVQTPLLNDDLSRWFNTIHMPALTALIEDTGASFPYLHLFTFCEKMCDLPSVTAFNQQLIKHLLKDKTLRANEQKEYLKTILPATYAELLYQENTIVSFGPMLSRDDEEVLLDVVTNLHPKFESMIFDILYQKRCSLRCSMIIFEQWQRKLSLTKMPHYDFEDICEVMIRQQYRSHRDDIFLNEQLRYLIDPNIDFMTLCFILRFYRPSHIPQLHLLLVELENLNHPLLDVQQSLIEPLETYIKNDLGLSPQTWCAKVRKEVFLPYLNHLFNQHLITHLQHYNDDMSHPLNFNCQIDEYLYSINVLKFIENTNSMPHQLYTYKGVQKLWEPYDTTAHHSTTEESSIIV